MDPNIGWYQPEQQGPALQLWERILDGVQDNHDYIPLTSTSSPSIENKYNSYQKADAKNRQNRASTFALNRNAQLIASYGGTPWRKQGKGYNRGPVGLHEEIEDFYEFIRPTRIEHRVRQKVVNRIKEVVKQLWPKAQCEVFGSFRTNLYLPTSDIDLVVLGEWDNLPMFTLEKGLIQAGIAPKEAIKVLDKASVPIVKLTEQTTQVKVDISFNQRNGVKSAKLIKEFCKKFPPLPKLVLVLKQYLLQRDLNEVFTGGISSYSLILLVVSFLQLHPRSSDVRNSHSNLGTLLLEFLEMYGRYFNYAEVGIRVKGDGCLMPKEQLQREMACAQGLNPSMGSIHDTSSILCIEDPLTPGNDIGRSSYGALNVQKAFDYAFITLEQAVHPSYHAIIDPKQSILGRVVRITDKVVEYRLWLDVTFPKSRPNSSLEELNDSQDEVELSHRLARVSSRENSHNNHPNRYSNGGWGEQRSALSVYQGNAESCSSSLSSVAESEKSWQDDEDYESRSDLDGESSDYDDGQQLSGPGRRKARGSPAGMSNHLRG